MSETPIGTARDAPDGVESRPTSAISGYVADESVLPATIRLVLRNWRWALGSMLVGAILALAGSFLVDTAYRSTVKVSVVVDFEGSGGAAAGGALGGLASLAGIQTQGSGLRIESLAVLGSRALGEEFIVRENLMPALFPRRWDAERNTWRTTWTGAKPPTIRQAYDKFSRGVLIIDENKETGLVDVGILWNDPQRASELATRYVNMANAKLRGRAIEESRASLKFLDQELGKNPSIPVQEAIFHLIEQKTKTIMIANVRPDFAFKVLDPAVPSDDDDPAKPRRLLMTIIGAFLGLVLGLLLGILRAGR